MDLSPGPLSVLAHEDFDALLARLRNASTPLGNLLDRLVHRHEAELRAAPHHFLPQLLARLPDNSRTAAWKAEAKMLLRGAPMQLVSRSLDGPERPLLWTRKLHSKLVHGMVILPDGDTVVSAGEDGRLLKWSLSTPERPAVPMGGHQGPVNHVAISEDGRWLATAGDDHFVGLWDTSTLTEPRMLAGHRHYVRQVAFGGDRLFSVSQDKTARVWSVQSGTPIRTIRHNQDVMSLTVTPDGEWLLVSLINSAMILWEVDSKKKGTWLYGNREQVLHVMGDIYLGGTNHGETGHKDYPHHMAFVDPHTAWSVGKEVILWDLYKKPVELARHPLATRTGAEAACWVDRDRLAIGNYGIQILKIRTEGEWNSSGKRNCRQYWGRERIVVPPSVSLPTVAPFFLGIPMGR